MSCFQISISIDFDFDRFRFSENEGTLNIFSIFFDTRDRLRSPTRITRSPPAAASSARSHVRGPSTFFQPFFTPPPHFFRPRKPRLFTNREQAFYFPRFDGMMNHPVDPKTPKSGIFVQKGLF